MGQIRVLPDGLIDQIAAGEVIERPAAVVRELIDNAIDAEASRIAVEIAGGGLRSITVSDDGSGLAPDDVPLAFRRHATSKIRTAEDLARVGTLGFRGEALPSIASVAEIRLRTRREQDPLGLEFEVGPERPGRTREIACAAGTRVEVIELFAAVPARRKFMKTAATEAGHVLRWVERAALARPDLRFELVRDGRTVLSLPATADARERVVAVLRASPEDLLEVSGERPGARLVGYASPTHVSRGSTSHVHLFVNGRPVRDRLLLFAVRDAYRDALPPGRHPLAVLYLQVDPGDVDVNVHPAKQEVRFRDPGSITQFVRRSLQEAIGRRAPERARFLDLGPGPGATGDLARPGGSGERTPGDFALARPSGPSMVAEGAEPAAGEATPPGAAPPLVFGQLRYVGQALGTFLVTEDAGGLVLIDQHAAHERVLFERLRQALLDRKLEQQPLLVPVEVELARSAGEELLERAEALARAGFEIDEGEPSLRGGLRLRVRAVPALLATRRGLDWTQLLDETAQAILAPGSAERRDGLEGVLHHVAATAACHAAVRKGDRLAPEEVRALLEDLDATLWVPNCPHGRPIVARLSAADVERRFLR